jgi:hypothetical protein
MTKTKVLLALVITALVSMSANAQQRVFVSTHGSDSNQCTVTQPCRTFQQAYLTVLANGEIDVLDPGGYGPLTMNFGGVSIQAHGFAGISQPCNSCAAITINLINGDPVSLNGLLLDGAGTGYAGILINSGTSVQILNSVVRHFQYGIYDQTTANDAKLLIEDTVASDNAQTGILIAPTGSNPKATLNRITANNNSLGVSCAGNSQTIIANSVISNNNIGLQNHTHGWLAKTVISGNTIGVNIAGLGPVISYGDNYIGFDNGTAVQGILSSATTQ